MLEWAYILPALHVAPDLCLTTQRHKGKLLTRIALPSHKFPSQKHIRAQRVSYRGQAFFLNNSLNPQAITLLSILSRFSSQYLLFPAPPTSYLLFNMGKITKRVKEFIENIPNSKLDGLPSTGGKPQTFTSTCKVYVSPINILSKFMTQSQMTSGDPKQHNSQVQINKQTKVTSLKKAAPQTVATLLVLKETLRPLLPLGMT